MELSELNEGDMMKSRETSFFQFLDGKWSPQSAQIPLEQAVTLIVNGKPWTEMLCTPAMVPELTAGFLYNEGLISSATDITRIHVCDTTDFVEVDTALPIAKPSTWIKTTGCGGGQTAQRLVNPAKPDLQGVALTASKIYDLLKRFMEAQDANTTSRGIHCSALSDGESILAFADDIGRHNTLDKLIGFILLKEPDLKPSILLTTGRISSEMLQKSARIGASVVISMTSPNAFTVQLAKEWGMTLIGYTRGSRFNIYTHPERFTDFGIKLEPK